MANIDQADIDKLLTISSGAAATGHAVGVGFGPDTSGLTALYATLGARLQAHASGQPDIQAFDFSVNPLLVDFGQKYFQRMQRACHDLLCGTDDEHKEARDKILEQLKLNSDPLLATALAGLLTAGLGVAVPIAAVLAIIILQVILKPAGAQFCQTWDQALKPA